MSASRPAPVPAIMPRIAAAIQAKSLARPELAPTDAATVVAFDRPVPAHAVPGTKARYSRASSIPAAPLHPMLTGRYEVR